MSSISKIVSDAWQRRSIEPEKRLRAGSFGWAVHRFPIKGGISLHDAMMRDMYAVSPGWRSLVAA